VESNPAARSVTRRVTVHSARRCTASARRGDRPGSNRYREAHNLGCSPLTRTCLLPAFFSSAERRGSFSQAGPRFDLELFKLSIPLVPTLADRLQKQRRRPGWVALDWLVDEARELARTPPSEGKDVTGPRLLVEAMPARQDRRGRRRFGKERWGINGYQHGFVAIAGRIGTNRRRRL